MDTIYKSILPFIAILNPFALCLYLLKVMEDLDTRNFLRVLAFSSVISLVVFWIFAISGEPLLNDVLGVRPEALRIFGGVLFFAIGYSYATSGYKATAAIRGSLDELPSQIAVPFMIGAGTVTQSIIIGKTHSNHIAMLVLFLGIAISFLVVSLFKFVRDWLSGEREIVFQRYVNILARINGLVIGAISTEMVISGLKQLWSNY